LAKFFKKVEKREKCDKNKKKRKNVFYIYAANCSVMKMIDCDGAGQTQR